MNKQNYWGFKDTCDERFFAKAGAIKGSAQETGSLALPLLFMAVVNDY